jgi:hypothetical protein
MMPAALLALGLLLAACSAAGSNPQQATLEPASAEPAEGSGPVTRTPATTSVDPPTPGPPMSRPPTAAIAVDGGDPVAGELGSFTWENSGSDSPWLDGNPIHVGTGEILTLTLSEPVEIDSWTASRVPQSRLNATTPVGLGEGAGGVVAFAGPPVGTWSVNVNVWFVDNLGAASYYWLVEVD